MRLREESGTWQSSRQLPEYERVSGRMEKEGIDRGRANAAVVIDLSLRYSDGPASSWRVLDVGCGFGFASLAMAESCREVVGIDVSDALCAAAIELATKHCVANVIFEHVAVDQFACEERFDVVVFDNSLEHMSSHHAAMRAAYRLVKPGGLVVIVVPNRLWPIEVHYGLPFLSYLPPKWANRYLHLAGVPADYTDASYAPTYWGLRTALYSAGFEAQFVVPPLVRLARGGCSLHYRLGAWLLRRVPALWPMSKMFVVVCKRMCDSAV